MKIPFSYQLLHIYGPFAIHSYGLFIALGILVGVSLMRRNKRFIALHLESHYVNGILVGIAAGVIGGRALAILSEPYLYPQWTDWFSLWDGGFSILGTIVAISTLVPLYLKKINVPIIPVCDLVSLYAPLMQSIARLGCFTAGCCHGIATQSICAVIYTNKNTIATYGIAVHPTQLYSSLLLFTSFLFMFFVAQRYLKKPGQLFATYLMLASTERFIVDFWRSDRIMSTRYLSFHQCIAVAIFCIAALANIALLLYSKHKNKRTIV